jgi:DNA-binding CsgD family transcriptional regulator
MDSWETRSLLGPLWSFMVQNMNIALAITDQNWVIEFVSRGVEQILGLQAEAYKGVPLLGLLRPAGLQSAMLAIGQVAKDGGAATLQTGLRASDGWRDVLCTVVAMCQSSPPRLGLAIVAAPEPGVQLPMELRRHVTAILSGVRDAGPPDAYQRDIPAAGPMSTRQREILARLVGGERVQDIAEAMYLSPSTVRNHLSAVYRKFGVHSQGELLAQLLRDRF